MPAHRRGRRHSSDIVVQTVLHHDPGKQNQRNNDLFRRDEYCSVINCHDCGRTYRVYFPVNETDRPEICLWCGHLFKMGEQNP